MRQTRFATDPGSPAETHVPRLLARPSVGLGSGKPVARFFYPLVTPRPQTCGCASTRISSGSKARSPLQPGERTHTHEDAEAEGTARVASRAGCLLCHHAPSPCLASCTPRRVRRAVWRTHTHSGLPRARGRGGTRRLPRPQRHARGTRFPPRDTPMPCPHTRSLAAAHGPPCAAHDRHRDTCNTPTAAPPAPRVARTSGDPSSLHPLAPAARARIKRAVQGWLSTAERARRELCTASTNQPSSLQRTAEHRPRRSPRPACPLARPFPPRRAPLGSRSVPPPQRAAPCTAQPLAQRPPETRTPHLLRRGTRHPPPRPQRTCCPHRVDARAAHGQVLKAQGPRRGG